ncbi:MAG: AAA family ATPase [Candidatus Neomarinimicrobiota bacterium]
MRIAHLKIENWRNFRKAKVDLQNRVFLIGPNASGKSNLLDVMRFLRDLASDGGGLQDAVKRRWGVSKIRCLAAKQYSDISITVSLIEEDEKEEWVYALTFNQDNKARPIIKNEIVTKNRRTILSRPDASDEKDPERKTQTHLEQISANIKFREISDFFKSIRYRHIVPQLIREPDRSVGRKNDPYGGDFLELMIRTNVSTRTARLKRIIKTLKIAVPQFEDLQVTRDEGGVPHIEAAYSHWRAWAAKQREDQFSDGTLRLLGLLWSVLDGTGPLLLEEPELSLHPNLVPFIPQMMARVRKGTKTRRQIIVSTHSTDLLNGPGIALDEVILLNPNEDGTIVESAQSQDDIKHLVGGDMPLGFVLINKTGPHNAHQLVLF